MKINYVKEILFISSTSMKAIDPSLRFLFIPLKINAFYIASNNNYVDSIGERMPETVIKPQCI